MLLNFELLKNKYKFIIDGVIHIGAHQGQEMCLYNNNNIENVIAFEPVLSNFYILEQLTPKKYDIFNLALGNENRKIKINLETANNGQSCSILNPKIHLQQYPQIQFNDKIEVDMIKLDDFMSVYHSKNENKNKKFNFINIDVQGYELEVFKGAKNYLNKIDYIIAEVNKDYVYENCALVNEIDDFLLQFNFKRVETSWDGFTWGDAFYIKK